MLFSLKQLRLYHKLSGNEMLRIYIIITSFIESPSYTAVPVEFPITEVHKAWFPIFEAKPVDTEVTTEVTPEDQTAEKSVQVGVVLLRLRITCFGSNMVAPLQYDKSNYSQSKHK